MSEFSTCQIFESLIPRRLDFLNWSKSSLLISRTDYTNFKCNLPEISPKRLALPNLITCKENRTILQPLARIPVNTKVYYTPIKRSKRIHRLPLFTLCKYQRNLLQIKEEKYIPGGIRFERWRFEEVYQKKNTASILPWQTNDVHTFLPLRRKRKIPWSTVSTFILKQTSKSAYCL